MRSHRTSRTVVGLVAGTLTCALIAQAPFERLYATGSSGSLLMGGDSSLYQLGGYYDPAGAAAYVIKSRQNGQTVWQKRYPLTTWGQMAYVREAVFDPNGDIRMLVILSTSTPCFGLLRIDTSGTVLSVDQYLMPSGFLPVAMAAGMDGSTYVVSSTFTLVKMASAGPVIWSRDHLADGSFWSGTEHDEAGDILLTSSGQLLVSSTSWRDSGPPPSPAELRQTVHEVDTAGAIIQSWSWRDTVDLQPYQFQTPGKLVEIPGGGLYVTGRVSGNGTVPFVMRLDAGFAAQWMKVVKPPSCGTTSWYQAGIGSNGGVLLGYRLCMGDDDGLTRLSATGAHLGSRRLHYTTLPATVNGLIPTADGGVTCTGHRHFMYAIDQPYLLHLDSTLTTPCFSGAINPIIFTVDPVPQPSIPYTTINVAGITHVPSTVTPVAVTQEGLACSLQVSLSPKLWLEGPYSSGASMMNDALRVAGLIPTTEPYSALGFMNAGGGGGEMTTTAVLGVSGGNAIVDWVRVEVRSVGAPDVPVATRHCLLQRDGDVVSATDGLSPVTLNVGPGSYYVAVRHRNHLGTMTAAPVVLSGTPAVIDFRSNGTATWGADARKNINGAMALWAGNVVLDPLPPFRLKYMGTSSDRDAILMAIGGIIPTSTVSGYLPADVNMDGVVKYLGANNDRDPILVNVGGTIPTNTRPEQLP